MTQFTRDIRLLHLEDGSKIEFCLDRGTISTDRAKMPLCELELELKSGNAVQLFLFALKLQKAFPFSLRLENISKAERGYILSSVCKKPPVKATRIPLSNDMCVNMAFKTIYWNCLEHLSSNEYGMLNKRDNEYLDQMRIALRRQRFALKIFSKILPKKNITPIIQELKWLTTQFNLAHYWGMLAIKILPAINNNFSGHLGIAMMMKTSKQLYRKHQNHVRHLIKSKRYLRVMLKIGVWLNTDVFLAKKKSADTLVLTNRLIKEFSDSFLNDQHQYLRKLEKKITMLNLSELHTLRTIINKQRYAAEFFADLYPKSENNSHFRSLHNLQHLLDVTRDNMAINGLLNELKINQKGETMNEATGIALGWNGRDGFQKELELECAWAFYNTTSPFWITKSD